MTTSLKIYTIDELKLELERRRRMIDRLTLQREKVRAKLRQVEDQQRAIEAGATARARTETKPASRETKPAKAETKPAKAETKRPRRATAIVTAGAQPVDPAPVQPAAGLAWREIGGGVEATSGVIHKGHACVHVIRVRAGRYHLSGSPLLYPDVEHFESFSAAKARAQAVEAEVLARAEAESDLAIDDADQRPHETDDDDLGE